MWCCCLAFPPWSGLGLLKTPCTGWRYVENDGSAQNLIFITGLKCIYSKQLPNMPKEYICRLIYERRHKHSALIKKNGTVIGGITYRAFPEQRMGEICFCAVTSSEQVKGYGTRLMNQTKEYARTRDNITHFLTFADNNAVPYFIKQGFTREITLSRKRDLDRWSSATVLKASVCFEILGIITRCSQHVCLSIIAVCWISWRASFSWEFLKWARFEVDAI